MILSLFPRVAALALALASFSASFSTLAQSYPTRPVKLVIPFAAGAGTDVVARTVTQKAADFLGQQIVAENRTGAAGNLGAEQAARSPADGYTLAILSTIHAANQSFYRKLGYSMAADFVPIAGSFLSTSAGAVMMWQPMSSASTTLKASRVDAQMISTFRVLRARAIASCIIGR